MKYFLSWYVREICYNGHSNIYVCHLCFLTFTHRMGRKFRLSTHRKNEERLVQRKKGSLLVSIPLDGLSLPERHDTMDGK